MKKIILLFVFAVIATTAFGQVEVKSFGYGPGYTAMSLLNPTPSQSIAIGYDVSTNPSSYFSGNGHEIVLRNGVEFITPNAANNNFHRYVLSLLNGNVGIGTNAPDAKLSISGVQANQPSITISHGGSSGGYGAMRFQFAIGNPGSMAEIRGVNPRTNLDSELSFATMNTAGTLNETMRINGNGDVGIGTSGPRAKLDLAGNMLIQSALHNSSPRPSLSIQPIGGEIRSYSQLGYGADDGLLRLSAGAGTSSGLMSYIDISSYSTIPDMNQNIVFGTAGEEKLRIVQNGNVLIGKTQQANASYKLDVNGKVRANEIVVNTTGADFVFENGYKLRPLAEVEQFIQKNKHLPEIANAKTMQEEGVGVSELQTKLLQKVEELTLYIIELNKKNIAQEARIKELEAKQSKRK